VVSENEIKAQVINRLAALLPQVEIEALEAERLFRNTRFDFVARVKVGNVRGNADPAMNGLAHSCYTPAFSSANQNDQPGSKPSPNLGDCLARAYHDHTVPRDHWPESHWRPQHQGPKSNSVAFSGNSQDPGLPSWQDGAIHYAPDSYRARWMVGVSYWEEGRPGEDTSHK